MTKKLLGKAEVPSEEHPDIDGLEVETKSKRGRKKSSSPYTGVSRKELIAELEQRNAVQFSGDSMQGLTETVLTLLELGTSLPYTKVADDKKELFNDNAAVVANQYAPNLGAKATLVAFGLSFVSLTTEAFALKRAMKQQPVKKKGSDDAPSSPDGFEGNRNEIRVI